MFVCCFRVVYRWGVAVVSFVGNCLNVVIVVVRRYCWPVVDVCGRWFAFGVVCCCVLCVVRCVCVSFVIFAWSVWLSVFV